MSVIIDAFERAEKMIGDLKAENSRLRAGIQAYLDGDYEPRVRKVDKCPHGQYGYEVCEACVDAHFTKLLAVHPGD